MRRYRLFGTYRFALALVVVLSHSWFLAFGVQGSSFVQRLGIGNIGVAAFFVMSGFVIAEALSVFYQGRPFAFLANRFFRLFPPYIAAVAVSIAVHAIAVSAGTLRLPDYDIPPADIFRLNNILINLTAIIPLVNFNNLLPDSDWYYFVRFAWAVFVEFVFYIVMAILAAALTLGRGRIKYWQVALVGFSGAIAVHVGNESIRFVQTAFSFIPYFTFGVTTFAALNLRGRWYWAAAALSFILMIAHFIRYTQGQIPLREDWISHLGTTEVWLPVALLGLAALVVPILSLASARAGVRAMDRWLGDLSYPLYLNHYAVLVLTYSFLSTPSVWVQLVTIVLSITLSAVMHGLVETPMRPLRDGLRGQSLREPAGR